MIIIFFCVYKLEPFYLNLFDQNKFNLSTRSDKEREYINPNISFLIIIYILFLLVEYFSKD